MSMWGSQAWLQAGLMAGFLSRLKTKKPARTPACRQGCPPHVRFFFGLAIISSPAFSATVIQDVTVIDIAAGVARPHMTVVIEGDRIASVERGGPIPVGARIVDGRGKFLIPGLWDMHVHLWH